MSGLQKALLLLAITFLLGFITGYFVDHVQVNWAG